MGQNWKKEINTSSKSAQVCREGEYMYEIIGWNTWRILPPYMKMRILTPSLETPAVSKGLQFLVS